MKIDCGLSRYEKIQLRKEWHRWFAWYPVRIGSRDCRWLEHVERKISYFYGEEFSVEYRPLQRT